MKDLKLSNSWAQNLYLPILLLVIFYNSYFRQSFWLDETISVWLASSSFEQVIQGAIKYQGQSPFYYLLLWGWQKIVGTDELLLRLPSIFFILLSALTLFSICKKLFSQGSANLALLGFFASDGIQRAFSARPYSLALFFFLASLNLFLTWLTKQEKESRAVILLSAVCAVLSIYAHYLFALAFGVHLLFLILNLKEQGRSKFQDLILASILACLLLIPSAPQLLSLFQRRSSLDFSAKASFSGLFQAILPVYILVYLIGALLLTVIFCKKPTITFDAKLRKNILATLIWCSAPAIFFYSYSALSGLSVFNERYFLWVVPGLCLTLAGLRTLFSNQTQRQVFCASFFLLLLIRESGHTWQIEDWRTAARVVNQELSTQVTAGNTPVLLSTNLVETEDPTWLSNPENHTYLTAPFQVYRTETALLLLPRKVETAEQKEYMLRLESDIKQKDRLLVVSISPGFGSLQERIKLLFPENEWESRTILGKGLVRVVGYQKRR